MKLETMKTKICELDKNEMLASSHLHLRTSMGGAKGGMMSHDSHYVMFIIYALISQYT